MTKKIIKGLRDIYKKYDVFFIDLWGVMHNGIELHPGAIQVLENLYKIKKRFVLMSNAPRPAKDVEKFLLSLNMKENFVKNVFTSGEATLRSIKKNFYRKNFYHLGPSRDKSLFKGLEKNNKSLREAEFILCTGFLENKENSLTYYKNLLIKYTKLKMICANPDLVVHKGSKKEYCAGKLAEIFENQGGKVIYFGKPHPEIYNFCTKKNEKVLVIGDNILTDIKGANNMNYDALLITSGIHKNDFSKLSYKKYDEILNRYKLNTNYYLEKLIW